MNFPKVEVTGGPHGKNTKVTIDGEELPSAHRVELVFDVQDVVRLKTFQFVTAHVTMELVPVGIEQLQFVAIDQMVVGHADDGAETREWIRLAEGKGKTLRRALEEAIATLPEDPA